ncbi:Serine/threonine-protein kinase KIN2 [Candida tropicalis]
MDNQDLNLQYQSRKVPPPNMVPPSQPTSQHQQQLTPHAPSGRPATPRMLRSISGTLKSKTELNNSSRERTQDYNNGANNTNSPHYVTNNTMDTHKRQPSFPQQTSTPVTQDQRNIKVQAPTAVPADQQQQKGKLLPPASIPSPSSQMHPAPTPTGVSQTTNLSSRQKQSAPSPASNQSASHNHTTSSSNSNSHAQHHHHHHHQQQQQQQQQHQQQSQQSGHGSSQQQQFHRKSIGDWDFVKTIGAGSMGKVKLAQHNTTHEICAVKIIPRAAKLYQRAHANDPPPQTTQEAAQRHKEFEKEVARDKRTIREGALGRLLYHPFICRLYEMVPMTNHYYMLFEYIEGGQMLDYIVAHGSLKERHARKFARGIASALDYCHRNNVVHRDLKIENIMINEKGDIKIIDFGLSNLYSPRNLLKTYCGSLYFAAPELLSAKPYIGPEVDVWSFGVVLYVLVCGKVPFDDQSVSILHEKIKKGNVEYPSFLSRECVSLLSKMLVVDPTKRASLYEVCSHPWMNKGYDHRVNNYLPKREPLRFPLDPEIIKVIANYELGTVQGVTDELTAILNSVEYQMSCENWYKAAEQGRDYYSSSNVHILPDPTGGFHPLVSIYYLVDEMRKRKKAKEEAIRAQQRAQVPTIALPVPRQQQQQQQQQPQQTQSPQQEMVQQLAKQEPVRPPSQPQTIASNDDHHEVTEATQVAVLAQISPANTQQNTPTPRIVETFPTLDPAKQQASGQGDASASIPTPPPASIPVPEQAHTSSGPSSFNQTQTAVNDTDRLSIPDQQSPRSNTPMETLDPAKANTAGATTNAGAAGGTVGGAAGFNSLLRRLSSKKYKGTTSPKKAESPSASAVPVDVDRLSPQVSIKADPMIRRGVSMKVTAKEKQTGIRSSANTPATTTVNSSAAARNDSIKRKTQHGRSASTSLKYQAFVPVEQLPPLPTIDTNTNTIIPDNNKQQQPAAQQPQSTFLSPTGERKMHPTARAKSVGGHIRKDSYGRTAAVAQGRPLPNSMANQNSDEVVSKDTDGFFDDVQLDDVDYQEVPHLTEAQIMDQYNHAKPNSMPSIEHCKTLFLKGFFSVQTTSSKPLPVIRYNIINVLSKLGVKFQEVKGGFVCVHTPSVQAESNTSANSTVLDEEHKLYGDAFKSKSSQELYDEQLTVSEGTKTPSRQPSLQLQTQFPMSPTAAKSHRSTNSIGSTGAGSTSAGGAGSTTPGAPRRKFSIGNAFNTYRKKNGSQVLMPPNTPATAKVLHGLYDDDDDNEDEEGVEAEGDDYEYDDSADSLNGYVGGSDMLISSRIEQRAKHQRTVSTSSQHNKMASKSPLKFEIHIVKVPLVGLYGVQFKKLLGNTWNYKTLASQILNEMNL